MPRESRVIRRGLSDSVTALVGERKAVAFALGEMRVAQHREYSSGPTVLHVTQPVDGGVARVVTDLVRAQGRDGIRTVVACPPGGTLGEAAAEAGAEVVPWQARRQPGRAVRRETAELARIVRETAPDLVHAHSAKAGLAARLAVRGRVPTVYQPHAWSFEAVTGAASVLALGWERLAARWSARVLCVSEAEQRRGRDAGVDAHWAVVRNGIDLDRFAPRDLDAGRRARKELPALADVPDDAPLVVCVGRLCRQKGQDLLLAAWPDVLRAVPDAHLVLVGDGPLGPRLREAPPAQTHFAGHSAGPAAWYAAADLAVQPSRWEGMALTPLEAMAAGRPVVLTEVAGARESLPPGQAPACLVPPEDPKALAVALVRLLTDPRLARVLGEQACRHVRANCDVRRTAAAVSRLYGELLGGIHPNSEESIAR
jgi:glycosyltransferase involved in cell wall biosynthesis